MEGYVNKEVCVNIELFLLVFVHEKSPRRAIAARERMSYGFLWIFAKYLTGVVLLKVGKYDTQTHSLTHN